MSPSSGPRHSIGVRLFQEPSAPGQGRLRILLLKLDHIGDFITALDAFRIVRQAFADAEITLICLPATVDMAKNTGLFDRVAGFSAISESRQFGRVPRMDAEDQIANFTELLDGRYFLAADFKHDVAGAPMLDHVDAAFRAGFMRPSQAGLDIALPGMEWDVPAISIGKKNLPVPAGLRLSLLAHAIADTFRMPAQEDFFHLPDGLSEEPHYQSLKSIERTKIGISLGAGSELRKWSSAYWLKLAQDLLQKRNAFFVFFGSPGDQEETKALLAMLPPDSCLDLTGTVPLAHIPSYMNLLDCYIGCDTGLTHMAARQGIATVNIFAGISNPAVWRARGPKVKTVYAEVICAPCHLRFKNECPNNNICMGVIMPEVVYACFEQLIPPNR